MNASIITVGDEILIGQIVDTNAAWIADVLGQEGVQMVGRITAGDQQTSILKALEYSFAEADLIIMTGGLGPTKDDITKNALAVFFDCDLEFSQVTFEKLKKMFEKRNIPLSQAHYDQCFLPSCAEILDNQMGTAPGMWFCKDGKFLCSMPGVPHEMKYVMTHGVIPKVRSLVDTCYLQRTIRTLGTGETVLAEMIEPVLIPYPVSIAYLPSQGQVRIRLSIRGEKSQKDELNQILNQAVNAATVAMGNHVFGFDQLEPEAYLGQLLLEKGLTIATAESCTGGYLAHLITSVPGSSRYYLGSIVAYQNEIKHAHLGVQSDILETVGAVSAETVAAMVKGVINSLGSDVGIAVSGISGPDGGTPEKPVGTVWIAVGNRNNIVTKKFSFGKDRLLNIKYTAIYAIDMLRKFLSA